MIVAAREALAATLAGVGVPVHAYPPPSVQPPAVVLIPGEPYLSGYTLRAGTARIGLQVQCVTADTAAQSLDDLVWAVFAALTAAGYPAGSIPPPRHDTSTGTLVARIPVTMEWSES